jgi:endoglycosylceramidase
VFWAAIELKPGHYNHAYLASISQTISQLNQYNIRVIVDFHQDGYSSKHGGTGFPPWSALGTAHNPNLGFPLNTLCGLTTTQGDTVGPNICQDWDAFWLNTKPPTLKKGIQSYYMDMLAYATGYLNNQHH